MIAVLDWNCLMIVAVSKEILSGIFHIVFSIVRAQNLIGYHQMSLLGIRSLVLKVEGNYTVMTVLCKVSCFFNNL